VGASLELDRISLCDDGNDGRAALNVPQELDVDALHTAHRITNTIDLSISLSDVHQELDFDP
jgi:hypothetical protein